MASSFSDLVDNLAEEIYKIKCKSRHDNENAYFITGIIKKRFDIKT